MKLTGRYGKRSDRKAVWDALQDPAVIVNTLPGVQRLEVAGPNRYSVTMEAGVGAIKSIFQGEFWAEELVEPQSCVPKGSASSSVGAVEFEAAVSLGFAEPAGTCEVLLICSRPSAAGLGAAL